MSPPRVRPLLPARHFSPVEPLGYARRLGSCRAPLLHALRVARLKTTLANHPTRQDTVYIPHLFVSCLHYFEFVYIANLSWNKYILTYLLTYTHPLPQSPPRTYSTCYAKTSYRILHIFLMVQVYLCNFK